MYSTHISCMQLTTLAIRTVQTQLQVPSLNMNEALCSGKNKSEKMCSNLDLWFCIPHWLTCSFIVNLVLQIETQCCRPNHIVRKNSTSLYFITYSHQKLLQVRVADLNEIYIFCLVPIFCTVTHFRKIECFISRTGGDILGQQEPKWNTQNNF